MRYPPAHRLDLVEQIHGFAVADPYRWLEDPASTETVAWSEAQDGLARSWLDGCRGRDLLREHLRRFTPGALGVPQVAGTRRFFTRRRPDQELAAYLVQDADGTERVLLDPNELSEDATVTLDGTFPSREGELLAYELSHGGDEESSLHVLDVESGKAVDGPIDRVRYGSVAWLPGGEAFYYVRRLVVPGEEAFHRRVWLHRVGHSPDGDDLIFGEGRDKTTYYLLRLSHDGRWLLAHTQLGTAPRNDLYLADLTFGGATRFVTVQEGIDARTSGTVGRDGRLYLLTDRDAPRNRLVVTDPSAPAAESWRELLPESESVLEDFALAGDTIVTLRSRHAVSALTIHDRSTGSLRRAVELPGHGVATIAGRADEANEVWVGYMDFLTPDRVLRLPAPVGDLEPWADAPGTVTPPPARTEQVTYRAEDGTEVRLFLVTPADAHNDGTRPTILYGYGGFSIAMAPEYEAQILAWVAAGGVYAMANLRGGSEEGEEWHRAGMRERKQSVFDDFASAAEWLIAEGWTSPAHLAIAGGSNGGLLVGAAITQRPDLFAAARCSAPLLDMVRYERFGYGETWNDEYGSAASPVELGWLLSYSPYHHVVEGTGYPAVLFTVFESDTRVDPLHARKLCAALQWATGAAPGERPILLRRETQVGHGARAISRTIDLYADVLAFFADRLGLALEGGPDVEV